MLTRESRSTLLASVAIGAFLTAFYYVHEDLPRAVRAPTSLILAPVAIVDGLSHYLGIPGIYGKAVPVFLVNCGSGLAIWLGLLFIRRQWQGYRLAHLVAPFESSEDLFGAVRDLRARLEAGGHAGAATELGDGFRLLNGLTDGWALFLDSIETVRADHSKQFAPQEQADLERIRKAVHAAVYRR
jgi:hypothetical protein